MSERPADRWSSIAFSVATHLLIAAALGWGYWNYKRPPPPQQRLAIDATVVDLNSLPPGTLPSVVRPASTETPPEAVPEPEPQPEAQPEPQVPQAAPPPQEDARHEKERLEAQRRAQEKAAQRELAAAAAKTATLQKAAEQRKLEQAEKDKAAKDKAAKDQAAKDKVAEEKAAKEKAAREKAAAEAKAAADAKAEEASRKAREEADRQKTQREAELRARMAAEEHLVAAQASGLMAQYQAQIRARIERAWIRPASAKPGLSCEVRITQVPGGEVVGVKVGACNGDETVRQSIEAAAYRASPLPLPPDPALFDRNLIVTFKPQD